MAFWRWIRGQRSSSVSADPVWAVPDSSTPDAYVEACLRPAFQEQPEERTFRSDPSFREALDALNSQMYPRAIKAAEKLVGRFSDFDLPYKWMASACRAVGQADRSRAVLSEGLAKVKRKSLLLTDLGETALQSGKIDEAVYWWCQALHCLARNPIDYNAFLFLGEVAEACGLAEAARQMMARVDTLRAGKIRLEAATAARLGALVRGKQTSGIATAVERIAARYSGHQAQGAGPSAAREVAAGKPVAAPPPRVIRFPSDRSLGYLAPREADINDAYGLRISARGTFSVPLEWGEGVALWIDTEQVEGLAPLASLGADDLQALHIHDAGGMGKKRPGGNDAQLAHVRTLGGLRELDLQYTTIGASGLQHVAALSGLEKLTLWCEGGYQDQQDFNDGLSHLAALIRVRELDIHGINGAGLGHISRLSNLSTLCLQGSWIQDAELAILSGLSKLEFLELSYLHALTDSGAAHMGALTSLRKLALRNIGVTNEGLRHLVNLSNLQELDLMNLEVTEEGLAQLRALANLRELNLYGDDVKAREDWLRSTFPGVKIRYQGWPV